MDKRPAARRVFAEKADWTFGGRRLRLSFSPPGKNFGVALPIAIAPGGRRLQGRPLERIVPAA
jgi:hypothetical protein